MEMDNENKVQVATSSGNGVQVINVPDEGHTEHSFDDGENHSDADLEPNDPTDYSGFSKKELVAHLDAITKKDDDARQMYRVLQQIRPFYDEFYEQERQEALKKFIAAGGIEEEFEYRGDDTDALFVRLSTTIRERKTHQLKQREEQQQENLLKRQELLDQLRVLLDSVDTSNQFDRFKELQKQWKQIGPISGANAKTVWASYHALVDRFYDNQSIYFELKELDRKKNLESKIELCERAEHLLSLEKVTDAVKELNDLHQEFKHIGPVPLDQKDAVWNRFKAASDAVYKKRDEYLRELDKKLTENLNRKLELCAEAEQFASFNSDRIKEWNAKTKELLDIQKKWEGIGGLPRTNAREVNKRFWSAFKAFFANKNAFFKRLDESREENLKAKNELIEQAVNLQHSEDWEGTARQLKTLQQKWKEIGPVPEKQREKVFKAFKEACDTFFERKRNQSGKVVQDQVENLKIKEAVLAEMKRHIEENSCSEDSYRELQARYDAAGFVPKKDISRIRAAYDELTEKYLAAVPGLTVDEKDRLKLEQQISSIRNDPMGERKIQQKEQVIRRKISKVENDIAVWRNNMEFFAKSKNAERYLDEFTDKINDATDQLDQLKQQLRIIQES